MIRLGHQELHDLTEGRRKWAQTSSVNFQTPISRVKFVLELVHSIVDDENEGRSLSISVVFNGEH